MMNFQDQVVLVTGAGQGIGQATALAFAAEGSRVIVNDVNGDTAAQTVDQIATAGGLAVAVQADISDERAVAALFEQARSRFGPVTTLINNAGYVPYKPFAEYSSDLWDKTINIDLKGVYLCTRAALPHMEARGGGYIVSIASVHASRTLPGTTAYAAAKAGVVGLTRTLALELGPQNIRVNCISPGAIETDALQAYFNSLPPEQREAERKNLLTWHPLGRFGQPRDIANVAVFLCSDRAEFIHGSEIVADGGLLARLL